MNLSIIFSDVFGSIFPFSDVYQSIFTRDVFESLLGDCRNSFFCAFVLFLAGFLLRSSVFGKSRSFTSPLFCVFVKNLDPVAGHRIQIFRPIQIFVLICSRFFMYSSVGSILWEATVGKLAAGEVDGRG